VTDAADILILGCGNDLRGDDALGPLALRELRQSIAHPKRFCWVTCCGLTPDLAEALSRMREVIFIDCSATGPIAQVRRLEIHPTPDADLACAHLLDLPALLAWTLHLYSKTPRATAFTVTGEYFGLSETLSPNVAGVFPQLIEEIVHQLEAIAEPLPHA